MQILSGYFAALPTPFTTDGSSIADRTVGDLVDHNLKAGLHGLYVGGSTGEAFLMTIEERARLLQLVAEASDGRTTLIAHVGDPNPAVSASLASIAAAADYGAISAVPPFYYQYGMGEIVAHYRWLAGQTDLPFLIYNFPALSGVRWTPEELSQLLELPNVAGVKNTCSDLYAFEQLRRLAPRACLLHGFDETLLAGLSMGADGGIGSTYNLQAARILKLADAWKAGDQAVAQLHQSDANRLIDVLVSVGVLPALKHMLGQLGLAMGPCRRPFEPLSRKQTTILDDAMDLISATSLSAHRNQSVASG
ncbi:MAG: N-acetylneuraminate lyase [Pseudomonadota bacterium]